MDTVDLYLKIAQVTDTGENGKVCIVRKPDRIPAEWLPDDAGSSKKVYSLELDLDCAMAPAVLVPWVKLSVPGLTAPIPLTIKSQHKWENLGINPATNRHFVDE